MIDIEEIKLLEEDHAKLVEENTILKGLLADRLSYEEKRYYSIKYDIDLG